MLTEDDFRDEGLLKAIFNQFDTNQSGEITKENMVQAMEKMQQNITNEELNEMMTQHDIDKNGSISFAEFTQIFKA
jgi:Ca2+-binding EF-hand superfamily protein